MDKNQVGSTQTEILQGTLDMLILQTIASSPAHGHTIAHVIERGSGDFLQVEHGSLYPALHRLEDRGWIASFWGTSENNRKAFPNEGDADQIRRIFTESLVDDSLDMAVHQQGGKIYFAFPVAILAAVKT